jgi:hypothetical protein
MSEKDKFMDSDEIIRVPSRLLISSYHIGVRKVREDKELTFADLFDRESDLFDSEAFCEVIDKKNDFGDYL